MTKKTTRFFTTINEAKKLMKLSIYEKWIKDKADMTHIISTGVPDLGIEDYDHLVVGLDDSGYPHRYPAWSTDALIKVCNSLNLLVDIEGNEIIVEDDTLHAISGPNSFSTGMRGYCLPWMLVKILKEYDKEYGAK